MQLNRRISFAILKWLRPRKELPGSQHQSARTAIWMEQLQQAERVGFASTPVPQVYFFSEGVSFLALFSSRSAEANACCASRFFPMRSKALPRTKYPKICIS